MNNEDNQHSQPGFIINSSEPLWEWDVLSDTLFWSKGARRLLRLENPPSRMSEYYELLPPDAAEELSNVHAKAIAGHTTDTNLECDYICKGLWIHEILVILARDAEGRATRVMGSVKMRPGPSGGIGFYQSSDHLSDVGTWVYHVPSGRIWRDKACRTILGNEDNGISLVSIDTPVMEVHPSEREAIQRHYELFCESTFLGEHITDMVHIKNGAGEYEPVLVRASAVERDEHGKARIIAGIIASNETGVSRVRVIADKVFQALSNMGSGHWTWDTHSPTVNLGVNFLEVLGYNLSEIPNTNKFRLDLVHPDDLKKLHDARKSVVEDSSRGDSYECTYRMLRADGDWAWMFERGCVAWRDRNDRAGQLVGSITNITTAQEERSKLEELVRADSLTGVHSRAYSTLEFEQLEQKGVRPVSIISIDITGLKMVNDSLGHAGGDRLLKRAAEILKKTLRKSDFIARTGGDEFLIMLADQNLKTATRVMGKIQNALEKANAEPGAIPVYAACGVACAETLATSLADAIARADQHMYANKKVARQETRKKLAEWIYNTTGQEPPKDDRI